MSYVNQLQAASIPVFNAQVPAEGPKVLVLPPIDFSADAEWSIDLSELTRRNIISMVQTIWIDAADSNGQVAVTVNGAQRIVVQAHSQGYYPIFAANPCRLTFQCNDNTFRTLGVILANVPVAPEQWLSA